jgi:hypothetical protein
VAEIIVLPIRGWWNDERWTSHAFC